MRQGKMAAKMLVSHLLRFEDFKQMEKSILDFIRSQKGERMFDSGYLESVDAIVSHVMEIDTGEFDGTESVSKIMILHEILMVVCLPLLRAPRNSTYDNDKGEKLKLVHLTYKLVSKITCGSPVEVGRQIWSLLFKSLENFVNECKHGFGEGYEVGSCEDVLDVATALDLLGSLLECTIDCNTERLDFILGAVLDVLKVVRSGSLLFKITGKILPALLSMDEKSLFHTSEKIWETIKCMLLQEQHEVEDNFGFFGSYAVMASLADVYFTPNTKAVFLVHHDPVFWTMLQRGLVNIDPLVRKRCLYLIQKAVELSKETCENMVVNKSSPVFWWNSDSSETLFKIWYQYVFLLEILEEKQLHVIKPVLHRLDELIDAAKKTNDFPFPLLHVSWFTVLVHRGAIHENRFIKKWAIMSLLTVDLEKVPLLEDTSMRRFASDTLIMLLKDPSLYAKNNGEGKGEPSKLTQELIGFFKKCFISLGDGGLQATFVNQIMTSIREHNISHVPLTFICQGLATLPRVPSVGTELLANLRHVLSNITSHSIVLRGAVQSFLLKTVMHVLDPCCVQLDDVYAFLGLFVKEESLCRGIPLWKEVGQWLYVNVDSYQKSTKDMFLFVDEKVRFFFKYSVSENNRSQALPLARFLLLCCDSSVIDTSEMNQLFDVIFSTISKAQSNPYHPILSCWQAVELLRTLFHELQSIIPLEEVADNIVITLTSRLHEVLPGLIESLQRTINQDDETVSFQGYRVLFELLDEVRSLWLTQKFLSDMSRKYLALVKKLADVGLRLLSAEGLAKPVTSKDWLRLVIAEKLIAWALVCEHIPSITLANEQRSRIFESVRSWNLVNDLRYPNSTVAYSADSGFLLKQDDWRVLVQDHMAVQWECVTKAVQEKPCRNYVEDISTNGMCTLSGNSLNEILDVCIEGLSLISGRAFLPCLTALRLFLPELLATCDESSAVRLLEISWRVLQEIRTRFSALFWPALDIVVRIIFAPELLILPAEHPVTLLVQSYWKALLKIADDQCGLVSVAVGHIVKVFSSGYKPIQFDICLRSLQIHVDVIADICVFGPVHKKDLRLLFDTAAYIKSTSCGAAVYLTKRKEFESETERVRVDILVFLLNLEQRRRTPFFIVLIKALLERNRVLSAAKTSRYLNSENHRQKQRLWQTILTLVVFIEDDAFAAEFVVGVFKALQSDNQTSVRFLMEWTLVRVLSKHVNTIQLIWQQFENIAKKRLSYVASLTTIAVHLLLALEGPRAQVDYLVRLLPIILPCAFLNHSQTRAYILDALKLVSHVCSDNVWTSIAKQYPVVTSCLQFADSVVEGDKEKCRLFKDRALFALHPLHDFCIEVIFETVPRIAGVIDEEIIPPQAFHSKGSSSWNESKVIPLYRRTGGVDDESVLKRCTADKVSKIKNPNESVVSDVQKKITPWQVSAPPQEDLDLFDQLHQRPIRRRVGNLVVVASLIDRAPNLGGLCRTCEIFGASKLVLRSKHVVSETGFQSVSVSSEKWMDVEEVKVNELVSYLGNMRREGYTIVGVEQTAQSTMLTNFQFPCNAVLVLGNEKAGIPVELIQLLDECVEIPQHGIIRSLNVHVSGALLIWEYSRQHLNDK